MAVKIFIDESGSITKKFDKKKYRHFIISIVHVKNERSLRSSFKRFLRKYKEELLLCDKNNNMFDRTGKFRELKGNLLTPEMKHAFIDHFCVNDNFKVYCQKLHNHLIDEGSRLHDDKERTFNFLIKNILEFNLKVKNLPQDENYHLVLDNRNVAVRGLRSLEQYLGATFVLETEYIKKIKVEYLDSKSDVLIQVADVFSNIFYSNTLNNKYTKKLESKIKKGYIAPIYNFPYKTKEDLFNLKQLEIKKECLTDYKI